MRVSAHEHGRQEWRWKGERMCMCGWVRTCVCTDLENKNTEDLGRQVAALKNTGSRRCNRKLNQKGEIQWRPGLSYVSDGSGRNRIA